MLYGKKLFLETSHFSITSKFPIDDILNIESVYKKKNLGEKNENLEG